MTKIFSPPYLNPHNPQQLTGITMRLEPDRYGFNSVWTRFEIRLRAAVELITTHLAHVHPDEIRIVTMNVMRCKTIGSMRFYIEGWFFLGGGVFVCNFAPYSTIFQLYDGGHFLLVEERSQMHYTMQLGRYHRPSTLQVDAGECGSNRFNTDIDAKLKSLQFFLNITLKFFFTVS